MCARRTKGDPLEGVKAPSRQLEGGANSGSPCAVDSLKPRGAIDVRDRRHLRCLVQVHKCGDRHEGRRRLIHALEPIGSFLCEHGGRERTEELALFDVISTRMHVRPSRIRQDGSVAQCTWSDLGAAAANGHNLAGYDGGDKSVNHTFTRGAIRRGTGAAAPFIRAHAHLLLS
eukprot:scaffold151728_cov28-Tisochrysis_lutea.AAC.2